MTMKKLFTILALVLMFGCASPTKKAMESWIGKSEDELMVTWGAPDSTRSLSNGATVHTWVKVWYNRYFPQQGRQSFTVDRSGTIVAYSYENMP